MVIRTNNEIAFYLHDHRNIDKATAWILPLLADSDRATMIKVQVFVLRKDTADIIGKIALQLDDNLDFFVCIQRSGPKRRQRFLTTSVPRTFRNLVATQDQKRSEL